MATFVVGTSPVADLAFERLGSDPLRTSYAPTRIETISDLASVNVKDAVIFVDGALLVEGVEMPTRQPVIALTNEPLTTTVRWLQPNEWLANVIGQGLLQHPLSTQHLGHVLQAVTSSKRPRLMNWLGANAVGRRVRLTHAHRRIERLERMSEYFTENGVGARTLEHLRDAAEELLTNAFYNAPISAGAIKKPVPRTQDIALPDECACDLAYGCLDDLAFVRVCDPFGSLSRRRLVEVLTRCAGPDVQVDESMGGAGLGMWRLFSVATFVAISVTQGESTEILIAIAKKKASPSAKAYAFHLFFRNSEKRRFWQRADEDDSSKPSVNKSVILTQKSLIKR